MGDRREILKKRVKRCVCKYCGSSLNINRIVFSEFEDARIELFCENCDRIEYGVEPEIYQCAKSLAEELELNLFPEFDDNENTKQLNIAKLCEIMSWENKQLGFLNHEGFQIPVNMQENLSGKIVIINDEDI